MSSVVSSLHGHLSHRSSRAAHSCCTRITSIIIAFTRLPFARTFLAPNTLQQQQHQRRASRTERHLHTEERNAATTAAASSSQQSTSAADESIVPASAASSVSSASNATVAPPPRRVRHVLITIHGYLGLPKPFFLFRAPAVNAGFHVVDYSYASGGSLDSIAEGLIDLIQRTIQELHERYPPHSPKRPDELQFNFVAHSMGGLVLRAAIASGQFPIPIPGSSIAAAPAAVTSDDLMSLSFGRIVMIATPNRGSQYARMLAKYPVVKNVVLRFAKLTVPGPSDINQWVRGITQNAQKLKSAAATSSASSAASSSSSSGDTDVAPGPLPDVLACGDLLMSHPPEWFLTHLPLPRSLYPRTLVIAGTFGIMRMLPTPHDGTITFEETKLPPPVDGPAEQDDGDISPTTRQARVDAAFASAAAPRSRVVAPGPAGSSHMSFRAPHSALVAHPGVIKCALQYILTGNAEPEPRRTHWD